VFRMLKSLFRRPGTATLVMEGHWCLSEIALPAKVRTPLGGNITIINVCVDIHYVVENGVVVVRKVELSRAGGGIMGSGTASNVAAARTGESWHATHICPESALREALESEAESEKARLRKRMLEQWRQLNRKHLYGSLIEAINAHASPAEIERRVATAGPGNDIAFTYTKPDGSSSTRKVTVQGVSGASLRASDHKDGQVKSFRIDRISKARAL
jgi:hypothetical protein